MSGHTAVCIQKFVMTPTFFISSGLLYFAVCLYVSTRTGIPKYARLLLGLVVAVSNVFFLYFIAANYLTGEGITEGAIYFTLYGLSGAGFSEFAWQLYLLLFLIFLSLSLSAWLVIRKQAAAAHQRYIALIFALVALSLYLNPTTTALANYFTPKAIDENSGFSDFYKLPGIERVGEPRNLLFIYVEGLERTYLDSGIFPGLTPQLLGIESGSTSYTNIAQDKYSVHTIGGMVASQCGFPLVSPSHANSMSGMDNYLQSAVCLGDLLHKENYYLSFYGGAGLEFAGKGKFFLTHHFDDVQGKKELVPRLQDKDYLSDWGLFDDSLLEIAYQEFINTAKTKNRFAMFLLTLDTHHPNGLPSKSCSGLPYRDGSNPMLNAVACSDHLIGNFVNKIRQSRFGKNTVIVIASDHLAFRNATSYEDLANHDRKNLFMINTVGAKASKVNTPGSTLDIASTVLPYMGFAGDIGLGRDLNSTPGTLPDINNRLQQWEPHFIQFWDFPKIEKGLDVDLQHSRIQIDGRFFPIPVLVELNYKLETNIKFEMSWTQEYNLKSYVEKIKGPFLLIGSCEQTSAVTAGRDASPGTCLLAGKGNEFTLNKKVDANTSFTPLDIRKMTKAF